MSLLVLLAIVYIKDPPEFSAFPTMLLGARLAEKAYAERRGPHPATKDNATDFGGLEENPLGR